MHFRLNSYPSMSIDQSTGTIAIAWTDDQGAGNCGTGAASFSGTTSNQVKLLRATWANIGTATPIAVTSGGSDKVFPATASGGGKTVVTYYTRDFGISSVLPICNVQTNTNPTQIPPVPSARSVCIDYAAKTSSNNFSTETRLSTESSNPFVQFADGSFIGDYSQVALGPSTAYGAWTDFRGKPGVTSANQDVVVQSFTP